MLSKLDFTMLYYSSYSRRRRRHRWFIWTVCLAFFSLYVYTRAFLWLFFYQFIVRLSSVAVFFFFSSLFLFKWMCDVDSKARVACVISDRPNVKRTAFLLYSCRIRASFLCLSHQTLINEQNENSIEKYLGDVPNDLFRADSGSDDVFSRLFLRFSFYMKMNTKQQNNNQMLTLVSAFCMSNHIFLMIPSCIFDSRVSATLNAKTC